MHRVIPEGPHDHTGVQVLLRSKDFPDRKIEKGRGIPFKKLQINDLPSEMSQTMLFAPPEETDEAPPKEHLIDGIDTRLRKWCVASNDLILARIDWNIHMNRIFGLLLSQIKKDQQRFDVQRIKVSDLRELAELSGRSVHQELADATQRLVREPIEFREGDRYKGYPIFSMCEYEPGRGYIQAKFNDDAREHILDLSGRFTKYQLRYVMKLSTSYAVRFYQIAKHIDRENVEVRTQEISVQEFREVFALTDKYERHSDMVKYVVEPSVREVSKKTEVDLEVETRRKGSPKYGKPVALVWTVRSSSDTKGIPARRSRRPGLERARQHALSNSEAAHGDPFDQWWEDLPADRQRVLREKAEAKVLEGGKESDSPSFEAYVRMQLLSMTREERCS